jgi:hypothetical protein
MHATAANSSRNKCETQYETLVPECVQKMIERKVLTSSPIIPHTVFP